MASIIEKAKDIVLEHLVAGVIGLFLLLAGIFWWALDAGIWVSIDGKIQKKGLWALIGILVLLVLALAASISLLRRKYNPNLIHKFGIYWTKKKYEPYCPKCKKRLGKYGEVSSGMIKVPFVNPLDRGRPQRTPLQTEKPSGTPKFYCVHCNESFPLCDDDGNPVTRQEAVLRLETAYNK